MNEFSLIVVFLNIILFCCLVYAVRYYVNYMRLKKAKNDIALLNAKIIALRMALRVRVKTKLSSFRVRYGTVIDKESEIDKLLNELHTMRYETGNEFQKYFDISKQIISHIKNDDRFAPEHVGMGPDLVELPETTESARRFKEFCGPDYKNEIALVRIIKEIADTTYKLSKKVNEFNHHYRNEKKFILAETIPLIQFDFLADINLVFRDSEFLLRDIQRKRSDFFNDAA